MNQNDYMREFGMQDSPELKADLILRQEQLEAQRIDDLLMAEVNYRDRIYMAGVIQLPFVTRDCDYTLNARLGVIPFCFTES